MARALIVGAGLAGLSAAVRLADRGFEVTVADDRPEFAAADRLPGASHVLCGDFGEMLGGIPGGEDLYIVLVTHGYDLDVGILRVLLRRESRYLGVIGSRRRVGIVKETLSREGFSGSELDRARP